MTSLELEIVKWSALRPRWQVSVLRRLAQGEVLRTSDFVKIATQLAAGNDFVGPALKAEEVPGSSGVRSRVSLSRLEISTGVNSLIPGQSLRFPADGMIVVYGDNGSGKSGFARLLKDVAHSRHREEVLSDIFSERDKSGQRAEIGISLHGIDQEPGSWPTDVPHQLQDVGFFDASCGDAYLATESEVTFRPAGIFILDGLIKACDAVQTELDRLLQENLQRKETQPTVSDGGAAAHFLAKFSTETSEEALDAACTAPADAEQQLEVLLTGENRLRSSDPNQEHQRLTNLADHYKLVGQHLSALGTQLAPSVISVAATARRNATDLRTAATVASAASFEAEPVQGVASQSWRALWEAARTFAETDVRTGGTFPADSESCVLCHQGLDEAARSRFERFEASVRDETQRKAAEAERQAERLVQSLQQVQILPVKVLVSLEHIAKEDPDNVDVCWQGMAAFERVVSSTGDLSTCLSAAELAREGNHSATAIAASQSLRDRSVAVDSFQYAEQLQGLMADQVAIKDSMAMRTANSSLKRELSRLQELCQLTAAKKLTDTAQITRKATELTRSHVNTLLRERFTDECDLLRLKRVSLEDTGGQKGRLQHRPMFVDAVQRPSMADVLSEGEQTALGLAGFFTEASLDESRSTIVLDDPVSSLDHIRRRLVAKRLAKLAKERQVIIFTHDIAFVADLALEAGDAEVRMVERSVERSGDDRPGVCLESHPWKTKAVKSRLGTLKTELAMIRRSMPQWQQEKIEKETAFWAGNLSETWERMLHYELFGQLYDFTKLEVRPRMLKIVASVTKDDNKEFQASYGRISRWVSRHDKSLELNYVPPTIDEMDKELKLVQNWFDRIKGYAKQPKSALGTRQAQSIL